jgi:hypothetical protein
VGARSGGGRHLADLSGDRLRSCARADEHVARTRARGLAGAITARDDLLQCRRIVREHRHAVAVERQVLEVLLRGLGEREARTELDDEVSHEDRFHRHRRRHRQRDI